MNVTQKMETFKNEIRNFSNKYVGVEVLNLLKL